MGRESANRVYHSANFLSAQLEAQKCCKLIRFVYRYLELDKSLQLGFSHRSPADVAFDSESHHGDLTPILAF